MGRNDRHGRPLNGRIPTGQDLLAAMGAVPNLGGPKQISVRLHWTPNGLGDMCVGPVALPDVNGNPVIFGFGGMLLGEKIAAQILTGAVDPSLSAEELSAVVDTALVMAEMLIAKCRSNPPAAAPTNPPAPDAVA